MYPWRCRRPVLGKGTTHAIQAGVMIGYEGMVLHMLNKFRAELDVQQSRLQRVAYATRSRHCALHSMLSNPNLTLEGLRQSSTTTIMRNALVT